jgi:hypothetical protein
MDVCPKFRAVRRGEVVVIIMETPVSAFFADPGLLREPFHEAPDEICLRFSYRRQLHKERKLTGNEVMETSEHPLTYWSKGLKQIRIKIEGREDVVIRSVRA